MHGQEDKVVPEDDVLRLVEKLQAQKNIEIEYESIPKANHFFEKEHNILVNKVNNYLDTRLVSSDFDL